ncbi:MAG: hypothetical protein ACNS60_06440, partial [Candidatus Cyclobacteriaceae bacterium M2_1C_046]
RMAPDNTKHVLDIRKNRIEIDHKMEESKNFKVRRSDLDINQHVNNVKYIEWALEVLPEADSVNEIDIEFRSECTEGEEIRSEYAVAKDTGSYLHRIIRMSDRKVSAIAESKA